MIQHSSLLKESADRITDQYLGVVTLDGTVKPRSMELVRAGYEYGSNSYQKIHGNNMQYCEQPVRNTTIIFIRWSHFLIFFCSGNTVHFQILNMNKAKYRVGVSPNTVMIYKMKNGGTMS